MTQRMQKQDEEMRRRQQENSLFMQAQQLNSMLDQQEMNHHGGSQGGNGSNQGGGRKNFNDNNDNRRNFDMMNQGKEIDPNRPGGSINNLRFVPRQPRRESVPTAAATAPGRKSGRKTNENEF